MASWDGGGNRPPNSPVMKQMAGPEGGSLGDIEQTVANDAEVVFENFMYQSWRQDKQRNDFDDTPNAPQLTNFSEPLSSAAHVGRQLAKIGDDINQKYASEFDKMARTLNIDESSAYEAFQGVARRLIEGGNLNWGRILTLFSFGYRIAVHMLNLAGDRLLNFANVMKNIVTYVVRFISDKAEGIVQWIASQGGWRASLTYVPSISNTVWFGIIASALVTAGFVYYLRD